MSASLKKVKVSDLSLDKLFDVSSTFELLKQNLSRDKIDREILKISKDEGGVYFGAKCVQQKKIMVKTLSETIEKIKFCVIEHCRSNTAESEVSSKSLLKLT